MKSINLALCIALTASATSGLAMDWGSGLQMVTRVVADTSNQAVLLSRLETAIRNFALDQVRSLTAQLRRLGVRNFQQVIDIARQVYGQNQRKVNQIISILQGK